MLLFHSGYSYIKLINIYERKKFIIFSYFYYKLLNVMLLYQIHMHTYDNEEIY